MVKSNKVNKNIKILDNDIEIKPVKKQKTKKNVDDNSDIINKPHITILENNLLNINIQYIIHAADIHVHKREREEEYMKVFDNWCENIKKKNINKTNSVIVLAGDILHDKTDLHPISVNLTKYLFISLCKITTVICIPGNHDVSLLNMQHNSIESIVKNLETENKLYLLNDEGYYQYYNILFGHTRFGQSKKVLTCDFDFDGYKCGLYHGIINGASDNGYEYKNNDNEKKYYTTNDFSDYDFVFLGDIHKHSFLKKNIAYSGSLIQQTIDESLNKGYILWDLEKGKGEFQKVHNEYGKIKIEIDEDGQSMYDVKKFPKNLDVRIDCKSFDRKHIDDIYKELNKNDIVVNKKIDLMVGSKNRDTKIVIDGEEKNLNVIKNTNDLSNLLILKLKENKKIDDKQIVSYKKVIDDLLSTHNFNDNETKRKIKLTSLEFNNMSIFGENNKIDFNKFKNVMGIIAPNSSGKSSFIDVILYSIFEECTRGDRFDLLNTTKNSFKSKIKLEINDVKYMIVRTLIRNSKTSKEIKAGVELYENNENISGKDKKDTDNIIKEKIGDINDFIITSIVTQKSLFQGKSIGFVELTSDKKRDILCKLARLDIYDSLFNDTSTKLRSLKSEQNKYTSQLKKYDIYGKDIINIRMNITKKKNEINDKIKKYEQEDKDLNQKIEEYKKIKYQLTTYDFSQIKNIQENNIDDIDKSIKSLQNKINKLNDKILNLKEELNKIGDIANIELKYRNNRNKQIQKINDEINNLTKQLWTDKTINYNKFDNNKNDSEIKKLINDKDNLEQKLKTNNETLDEINKVINKKIKVINKKDVDEYNKFNNELIEVQNKKQKDNDDLEEYKERLDNLGEHEYDIDCIYCMKNGITKEKILLENSIKLLSNNIVDYDKKIKKYTEQLKKNNKIIEQYNNYLSLVENKKNKGNEKMIIMKDNEIFNEKIKNMNNKIKELKTIKINYKKFLENDDIKEQITTLKDKINSLQDDVCKERIRFDELNKDLLEYTQELEELNKKLYEEENKKNKHIINKELIEKYKIYTKNEKNINKIQEDINDNMDKLNKIKNENILLQETDIEITMIEKNINDCNKIYDQYLIINNILKDGGLIESIMKDNLLPRFNQIVNDLFIKFGARLVNIKYEKKGDEQKKHVINIYDDNRRNTNRDGGYQTFLNNLIYRIALSELNPNMKPNFMIIDEAFDSADNNNKQEMKKLINYLRSQHDWILIVSHDDDVKDTFDNIIEINDNLNDMDIYDGTKSITYV
jgi:DNA repair exonuclease SbcCD ATPase subunit